MEPNDAMKELSEKIHTALVDVIPEGVSVVVVYTDKKVVDVVSNVPNDPDIIDLLEQTVKAMYDPKVEVEDLPNG